MRFDVITIGAATRDVFLTSDVFTIVKDEKSLTGKDLCFGLGSKNELSDVILTTGGGATNAAVTFARQGFKVGCICRVGDEESGHDIVRELVKENIYRHFVQHDKKVPTAYSTILMTKIGERVVLVKRGASDHIKFNEIDLAKAKNTKWFYISSVAGDIDLLKKVITFAKKNSIKVAFNPGAKELSFGLSGLISIMKDVDVFIVNEEEAASLVGVDYKKEKEIFDRLDDIIQGIVVMTKGSDGVVVSDGRYLYKAGIPKSPVVSRLGAGDAFGSGFVSGLLHGKDASYGIQLGTANSTSVIQHLSAKTGILHKGKWGKWSRVRVKVANL